jgi:hypothetical protein
MLMLNYILSAYIFGTLFSGILAGIVGSIIGLIVGVIRKKIRLTILTTIVGCFVGIMWICIIPLYGTPGVMQGWGMGGGLGSLAPLMMMIGLGSIGALTGAITGSTFGFRFLQSLLVNQKKLGILIGIVYLVVALSILLSFSVSCINSSPADWYCKKVGF